MVFKKQKVYLQSDMSDTVQCSLLISKKLKNWNLKTSFWVLTFTTPLGIQLHTHVKQKYQAGSEAITRCSQVSALKLLYNRPGD